MIRRFALVAAAAAALVLVPSVAMAYDAPGYSSSVSDSTPVAGHPITVTVHGLPNEMIKLVVTSANGGVQTYSKRANANGEVKFTFKSAAGTTTLQAYNAAGQLVSDQTLTAGETGVNVGAPGNGNGGGGKLSDTGFNGTGLAVGGGVLVFAGTGAVVVAKRRRSAKAPA